MKTEIKENENQICSTAENCVKEWSFKSKDVENKSEIEITKNIILTNERLIVEQTTSGKDLEMKTKYSYKLSDIKAVNESYKKCTTRRYTKLCIILWIVAALLMFYGLPSIFVYSFETSSASNEFVYAYQVNAINVILPIIFVCLAVACCVVAFLLWKKLVTRIYVVVELETENYTRQKGFETYPDFKTEKRDGQVKKTLFLPANEGTIQFAKELDNLITELQVSNR